MDYLYLRVEDAEFTENTPLRRAFRKHLNKVAKALQAIEWADSCDWGEDRAMEAIEKCLAAGAEIAQLIKEAQQLRVELGRAIDLVEGGHK